MTKRWRTAAARPSLRRGCGYRETAALLDEDTAGPSHGARPSLERPSMSRSAGPSRSSGAGGRGAAHCAGPGPSDGALGGAATQGGTAPRPRMGGKIAGRRKMENDGDGDSDSRVGPAVRRVRRSQG